MSQAITGKRNIETRSSSNAEGEQAPQKKQKTDHSAPVSMSDDAAAKVLATMQTNGTSSSSNSKENGLSHSHAEPLVLGSSLQSASAKSALEKRAQAIEFCAQKKFTDAIETSRSAIALRDLPTDLKPSLFYELGRSLALRAGPGDLVSATDNLRAALAMPTTPKERALALIELGRALLTQDKFEEAIDVFQEAIKTVPDDLHLQARAQANIGVAYGNRNHKGDHELAIKIYEASLAIKQPDGALRAKILGNLAAIYVWRTDEERRRGIELCKEALKIEHEDANAKAVLYSTLGDCLFFQRERGQEEVNGAIEAYKRGIQLLEKAPDGLMARLINRLSQIFIDRNGSIEDLAWAHDALTRAQAIEHSFPHLKADSLRLLAETSILRAQRGDRTRALELLRASSAIKHHDNTIKGYVLDALGRELYIRNQNGDLLEALKVFATALKLPALSPALKPSIYFHLARALKIRNAPGDQEKALGWLELAAIQANDTLRHSKKLIARIFAVLGDTYQTRNQEGDLSRAIDCFQKAIAVQAEEPSTRIMHQTALLEALARRNQQGDMTALIDLLTKLISQDAKNVPQTQALKWIVELTEQLLKRNGQGDLSRAIEYYKTAIEALAENEPEYKAGFLFRMGRELMRRGGNGDLTSAINALKTSVELYGQDPRGVMSLKQLGHAYQMRGHADDPVQAAGCFLSALKRLDKETYSMKDELLGQVMGILSKKTASEEAKK